MIGLLDNDALVNQKVKYPNLELMKMASYLRRTKQSYRMVLDAEDLDIYTKVMVFQHNDKLDYPLKAFSKKGTEWFGLAFSGGTYKPMAEEIEECAPDITVYKQLFRKFLLEDKMEEREIGYLLNSSYVRLAPRLNKRYIKTIRKNRRVIVYDSDAFTGSWEENARALLKREITGFHFINLQKIYSLELWKKIYLEFERRNFNYNPIALDIPFRLADMKDILAVYEKMQGKNKTMIGSSDNLIIYVNIQQPYRAQTKAFAEAIGRQILAEQAINWRMGPNTGNPYHSFVASLAAWASRGAFMRYTYMEYLYKNDLHRQIRFANKLIHENLKYQPIFTRRVKGWKEVMGGLREYELRRNQKSIFSDYLQI